VTEVKTTLYYFPQVAGTVFFATMLAACDSGGGTVVSQVVESQSITDGSTAIEDEATDAADGGENVSASEDAIAEQPESSATDTNELQTGAGDGEFEATFRAIFDATWSAATHPTNFPFNPHFSPLTGAVHSEQTIIWQPGELASPGIEIMAETGGTGTLLSEINFAINEGRALSTIEGGGIATSPGSTSVEFTVNRNNSQVTLVSMLAPSPDWFIGVHGLDLIDQNGDFRTTISCDADQLLS